MLTEQQLNQIFIASLRERADPNAIIPVKFNAFDRFVRTAQIYSKYMYYLVLTFVFTWSVLFISFKGILLFVVMLGLVDFYCILADKAIKDASKWYWYELTNNHLKVHSEGCVPFELDECSCPCSAPEKDSIGDNFIAGVDETTSSIPSEDTEIVLDSVHNSSHCDMRGVDGARATCSNLSNVLGEKGITVGFVGHDAVVGGSAHVPKRDLELVVDHRVGDNSHIGGEVVSVRPNLYFEVPKVDGNVVSSGFLKDEVLDSSLSEDMDVDTSVSHSFDRFENVSGDSETSFSTQKFLKHDPAPRSLRLRIRSLAFSCSGAPRCVRLRPLRRCKSIYSPSSSFLVEDMEIDSFEEMWGYSPSLKEQVFEAGVYDFEPMDIDSVESLTTGSFNDFEPMDIDSSESLSGGNNKELVVVEEADASYFVGKPTMIEAGPFGSFDDANSQTCESNFWEDSVPQFGSYSFVKKDESIKKPVSLNEYCKRGLPKKPFLVQPSVVSDKEEEEIVASPTTTAITTADAIASTAATVATATAITAATTTTTTTTITTITTTTTATTTTAATSIAATTAVTDTTDTTDAINATNAVDTADAAIDAAIDAATTDTTADTTINITIPDSTAIPAMNPSGSRKIIAPTNRLDKYKKKHKSTSFIKDYEEHQKTKADISALFDEAEEEEEQKEEKKKEKRDKKKGLFRRFDL